MPPPEDAGRSVDDDDPLSETLDILSRPDEVAAILRGMADVERGDLSTWDEVRAAMVAAGRWSDAPRE